MLESNSRKLIFVYNASSGLHNVILDSAHKLLSPSTYKCNLCDITFGVFFEDTDWKKFREETPFEMEFLHKDEFIEDYGLKLRDKMNFPIVLSYSNGDLDILISSERLNKIKNAEELIALIQNRT